MHKNQDNNTILANKNMLQSVRRRGVQTFLASEINCSYSDDEANDIVLYLEGEYDAAYFGAARLAQELSDDLNGCETNAAH